MKTGQICWADDQVKVIRDFDTAEQQERLVALSIFGGKERSHPGQPPILVGNDNRQF